MVSVGPQQGSTRGLTARAAPPCTAVVVGEEIGESVRDGCGGHGDLAPGDPASRHREDRFITKRLLQGALQRFHVVAAVSEPTAEVISQTGQQAFPFRQMNTEEVPDHIVKDADAVIDLPTLQEQANDDQTTCTVEDISAEQN